MLCSNQLSYIAKIFTAASDGTRSENLISISRTLETLATKFYIIQDLARAPKGREFWLFGAKKSRFPLVDDDVADYGVIIAHGAAEGGFADLFIVAVNAGVFAAVGDQGVKAVADNPQIPGEVAVGETGADAGQHAGTGVQFLGHRFDCPEQAGVGFRDGGGEGHDGLYLHASEADQLVQLADELLGGLVRQDAAVQLGPGRGGDHIDLGGTAHAGHGAGVPDQGVMAGARCMQLGHEGRVRDSVLNIGIGTCPFLGHVCRQGTEVFIYRADDAGREGVFQQGIQGLHNTSDGAGGSGR